MTENGTTFKGPWWITVVERTGSLGLVLIMLVGAFFLAKDYTNDMRKTWMDIHGIIQTDNAAAREQREQTVKVLMTLIESNKANHEFLRETADLVSKRLETVDTRLDRLEERIK